MKNCVYIINGFAFFFLCLYERITNNNNEKNVPRRHCATTNNLHSYGSEMIKKYEYF